METLPVLLSKRPVLLSQSPVLLRKSPAPVPGPTLTLEPVAAASGWDCLVGAATAGNGVSEGRLARMRQRADLLIARMLADDDEQPDPVAELASGPEPESEPDPDPVAELTSGPEPESEPDPDPELGADSEPVLGLDREGDLESGRRPHRDPDSEPYPMPRPVPGPAPDPAPDPEPDPEPRGTGPDRTCGCGELLPQPAAASAGRPAGGYQSKHRLTGPPREPRTSAAAQRRPRHAAPTVSLHARVQSTASRGIAAAKRAAASGTAFGRRLGPVRLTSRSAAHAGW